MNAGSDGAVFARLHRISGGSSDTDENELTVSPSGLPSTPRVVTTVTPVVNRPSARRNSLGSLAERWARLSINPVMADPSCTRIY